MVALYYMNNAIDIMERAHSSRTQEFDEMFNLYSSRFPGLY
jgi:hypothetical protein